MWCSERFLAQVQTNGDIKWWFIFWLFENSHSITVIRDFLRYFSSVDKIIVQNITYIHVHPSIFGYKIRIRDEIVFCLLVGFLFLLYQKCSLFSVPHHPSKNTKFHPAWKMTAYISKDHKKHLFEVITAMPSGTVRGYHG